MALPIYVVVVKTREDLRVSLCHPFLLVIAPTDAT